MNSSTRTALIDFLKDFKKQQIVSTEIKSQELQDDCDKLIFALEKDETILEVQ